MSGKLNGTMAAHTPTGLTDQHFVDTPGDVLCETALQIGWRPAGHLDVVDGALHLAAGQEFAVFLSDATGDILDPILEEGLQAVEPLCTLVRARSGANRGAQRWPTPRPVPRRRGSCREPWR